MKIKFLLNLVLGVVICLSVGCTKEISYDEGGKVDVTAKFSIASAGSDCADIKISGHFLDGITLTDNETMRLAVDVVTAGQWKLETDTLNGFYFAGSGNFSATGVQEIVLTGKGIPLSPGNYRFSITDTSAATFLISVLKHDITEETVGTRSYLKATIGGVNFNFSASLPNADDIPYGSGGSAEDVVSFASFLVGGTYPSIPGPGVISLQKNFIFNYSASTDADFKNFFKPGAYPYNCPGSCNFSEKTPGILLFWAETGGKFWSTRDGSGNQEGSSFTIVGIEDGHNNTGNYFVKVKSRFNCMLYTYETGESIALTDGEMVSYFIKPL
jgi:hypothetical protein